MIFKWPDLLQRKLREMVQRDDSRCHVIMMLAPPSSMNRSNQFIWFDIFSGAEAEKKSRILW